MDSLLAKARPEDLRWQPFPHLVIEQALPAARFEALRARVPGYEAVSWRGNERSNERFPYSARMILRDPAMGAWHDVVRHHVSAAFFREVAALFAEARRRDAPWAERRLGRLEAVETGLLERDDFAAVPVLQDCRIEINTPVRGAASTVRGPHLDLPSRLYSILWYLRAPDDDSRGGDLQLWRWRGQPRDLTRQAIDEAELEPAATIPYAANTLVAFWNTPHALHGVSPRHPTPHQRQYLFVTAEVAEDLF
ncbi:2OG-Fe(II) oxygenase superfamily protein [Tistlia consotensis]|uniref:2OG-Fe(II) oxygenase superfamily protein n=1 Tax=Tistlia consotensis USBA 355 TaxID=560819 RepID=A0A1Y6CR69_9PROT|nr:2OG-Fe(II) oxygenase [Tistlia consotensis]SMF83734.1 2OG-Fe(II) oxygenase superfamily protein [Tistlia consotensis USBA 355]SNS34183.1 2OG-Fe(II) oxygenase superfamily protein [Tistlia consotensis]